MKYLIMTEGAAEKAVFDALLDRELLIFKRSDVLGEKVNKCRNIKSGGIIHNEILSLDKEEKIIIIRCLDKNTALGKLPKNISKRPIEGKVILTKQEIEILHIIADGKIDRFLQHHSGIKPSEYLCKYNKKYDKSEEYWKRFLSSISDEKLVSILNEYEIKRKNTHGENEFSFYDFINSDSRELSNVIKK